MIRCWRPVKRDYKKGDYVITTQRKSFQHIGLVIPVGSVGRVERAFSTSDYDILVNGNVVEVWASEIRLCSALEALGAQSESIKGIGK